MVADLNMFSINKEMAQICNLEIADFNALEALIGVNFQFDFGVSAEIFNNKVAEIDLKSQAGKK